MIKNLIHPTALVVFFAQFFLVNVAFAQKTDTTIIFYKIILDKNYTLNTSEDADFIRKVSPPDPIDQTLHIIDYYPDGKIMMKVNANPQYTDIKAGFFSFAGTCTSYYPNGNKQNIAFYSSGQKTGIESMYYPDGKIYYTKKYISPGYAMSTQPFFWDCYDISGNQVCREGNGQWINYYDDYKHVQDQGTVKKGMKDGEWKGYAKYTPLINYVAKYSKNKVISGTGYDSAGKAYTFEDEMASPYYGKKSPVYFVEIFHTRFKVPKDAQGQKINMDEVYFSFIIEKDESISNVDVSGSTNTELKSNVNDAMMQCKKWSPTLWYGVPLRTKLTFKYKISEGRDIKGIMYHAEIIGL